MMRKIANLDDLQALYGQPVKASVTKVMTHLTPLYRRWIEASRFVILSTVGLEGTDSSPRGDDGPVVRLADDRTIWLPDWRGNNRIDNLRNIVRDPRVSLLFMVPGCNNVVRVNGTAFVTDDSEATGAFEQGGKHPKTVIVVEIGEIYFQCAKALMRSGLWSREDAAQVPTAGDFVKEVDAAFDGAAYDLGYADYARDRMW